TGDAAPAACLADPAGRGPARAADALQRPGRAHPHRARGAEAHRRRDPRHRPAGRRRGALRVGVGWADPVVRAGRIVDRRSRRAVGLARRLASAVAGGCRRTGPRPGRSGFSRDRGIVRPVRLPIAAEAAPTGDRRRGGMVRADRLPIATHVAPTGARNARRLSARVRHMTVDPAALALEVLHRDEWLAVVNKPAGLMVHDSALARGESDFVADRLRVQFGRPIFLVHRLDRATSGCLLCAFDRDTASALGKVLMSREVEKDYWTV